ncbi:MAG: potassium channel family protein [Micromonosporaceae bacterium]
MPTDALDDPRLTAWEGHTDWPLTGLALLFLAGYAVPILRPSLSPAAVGVCDGVQVAAWGLFGIDYLIRLAITRHRWVFVREHLFDLTVLLLPLIGPLRMLRLIAPLTVLSRRARVWTRGRLALYLATIAGLLIFVSSLAVLDAERTAAEPNITTFPEAVWWSLVTATTVGYGDHYPVTVAGKVVAATLMLGGIGLIGFVTGSLASWVIQRINAAESAELANHAELMAELRTVRAELAELRTLNAAEGLGAADDAAEGPPRQRHGADVATAPLGN